MLATKRKISRIRCTIHKPRIRERHFTPPEKHKFEHFESLICMYSCRSLHHTSAAQQCVWIEPDRPKTVNQQQSKPKTLIPVSDCTVARSILRAAFEAELVAAAALHFGAASREFDVSLAAVAQPVTSTRGKVLSNHGS